MTGRRNTIIAVSAIVLFAAIVGFFITLDVSPQIAYARLFIDVGLVIGLVAIILAFYRETTIATGGLVHALGELSKAKYHTRLSPTPNDPLADVVAAVNELAKTLEAAHQKQEEIKQGLREELLPSLKEKKPVVINEHHSIHPELGPVLAIPFANVADKPKLAPFEDTIINPQKYVSPVPPTLPPSKAIQNTLFESAPPEAKPVVTSPISKLDEQDQDLGELYQDFIRAQEEMQLSKIDYTNFLKSVEKTRQGIIEDHQCQGVYFNVVKDQQQVALQPLLIRENRV